jgi:hypothetical protein
LSSSRSRVVAAGVVAGSVVVVVAAAMVGLSGGTSSSHADPSTVFVAASASATPSPSDAPSPTPIESPTPSPTKASPTPKPPAAKKKAPPPPPKPVKVAKPPPAPPGGTPPGPGTPPAGATCPKLTGPIAAKSEVSGAMSTAAGRSYRPTLSLDDANPPAITVRLLLVQGVGWEESGWQSTIESCDGGYGTMQVMTDTATWMNEKYGTSYDRKALAGNISIATGFLAWLTRYFGDKYFNGNYSLAGDPVKVVLLDMVISAYQAGFGTVDNAIAAGKDLPNRWYVDTVEGFMTNQPWT